MDRKQLDELKTDLKYLMKLIDNLDQIDIEYSIANINNHSKEQDDFYKQSIKANESLIQQRLSFLKNILLTLKLS